MILADQFVFKGTRDYIEDAREKAAIEQAQNPIEKTVKIVESLPPPTKAIPPNGAEYFESIPLKEQAGVGVNKDSDTLGLIQITPPIIKNGQKAKIAIIIDDVGMDIRQSKAAIDLPAPITLALLPYAPRVREFANAGKDRGHTLIIHVPMEAMDRGVNIGPMGLRENMDDAKIKSEMDKILSTFDGYEGINNHMGSRLTQNQKAMKNVMAILKDNNLFFVDSKTAGNSVAADIAAQAGLRFAERDIFLDHIDTPQFVQSALKKLERLALSRGYAIAIGHPKQNTMAGLRAWIPTLADKGIELVSVKELLSSGVNGGRGEVSDVVEDVDVSSPNYPPETGEIKTDNFFYEDINKTFAPEYSEPEIVLHPLPPQ